MYPRVFFLRGLRMFRAARRRTSAAGWPALLTSAAPRAPVLSVQMLGATRLLRAAGIRSLPLLHHAAIPLPLDIRVLGAVSSWRSHVSASTYLGAGSLAHGPTCVRPDSVNANLVSGCLGHLTPHLLFFYTNFCSPCDFSWCVA